MKPIRESAELDWSGEHMNPKPTDEEIAREAAKEFVPQDAPFRGETDRLTGIILSAIKKSKE